MSILVAVFGLAFLILIHEAGHFVVALAVGMRPRSFYVGFPFPPLVKVRRRGIDFGIGAIPLGGMVKIPGMHRPAPSDVDVHLGPAEYEDPELVGPAERLKRPLEQGDFEAARGALPEVEEAIGQASLSPPAARAARRGVSEIDDALAPDAYWRQPTWKRIAVIAAGPGTNLVFAIVLLAIVYMLGIPVDASRRVANVEPGSPAAGAGLRPGDEIIAINHMPTPTFKEVSKTIKSSDGKPLLLSVVRNGRYAEVGPVKAKKTDGVYVVGFRPGGIRYRHYDPARAVALAAEDTWAATTKIAGFIGHIAKPANRDQIATPVGIVSESSKAVRSGVTDYLAVLALISLSLALLNLLPLLPLDGGHIAFSVIEGLRGRAVGRGVYERVSAVGIALVLVLFVIGLSNDVDRLGGG